MDVLQDVKISVHDLVRYIEYEVRLFDAIEYLKGKKQYDVDVKVLQILLGANGEEDDF